MTREEATQWLKHINITDFGWDDYAMQDSQKEIRERCEQSIREAVDMAIESLNREQQIIENGCTGKEMRIHIGGKLFAVRELAQ